MDYLEVEGAREFVARLDHGGDWRAQIEEFAADEGVKSAFFVGLGAVQDAEIYFYDQDDQEYDAVEFDEPLEMAACLGNVSDLDGEPFAHTHAVLSRADVRTFDVPLERAHDETTDLDLWPL
ncbi:DNA-binding protein [Halobacteriales archaeon QH_7_68_42]|nr:MAG: DNA-binding protein [Halobacteriales archaeon QH_7_68_42]